MYYFFTDKLEPKNIGPNIKVTCILLNGKRVTILLFLHGFTWI
jgi:hypothetical protein